MRERGQPSDQEHKKEKCELEVVNACGLHGALSRESRLIHRVLTATGEFAVPQVVAATESSHDMGRRPI